MAHVLALLAQRIDDLLAGDDPCEAHLGYRGLGALAERDPRRVLDAAVHQALEVFKEAVVIRGDRVEDEARFSSQVFLQESVVQNGGAVGAELNEAQPDNHAEGEGGETDSEGEATCQ